MSLSMSQSVKLMSQFSPPNPLPDLEICVTGCHKNEVQKVAATGFLASTYQHLVTVPLCVGKLYIASRDRYRKHGNEIHTLLYSKLNYKLYIHSLVTRRQTVHVNRQADGQTMHTTN